MNTFNRGLDDAFVTALNEKYDESGWWRKIVDDQEIFLAIRENYVNVYYRGCSLLRLDWKAGAIIGETHYKYLLNPSISKPYAKVDDGQVSLPGDTRSLFLNSLDDLSGVKKAARPYAGDEKTAVHDILAANPNILDVEIAFGTGGTGKTDPSAPRVDFAAIQNSGEGAKIVFFEAKHFDNKALRASGDAKPDVVRQIEAYSGQLKEHRAAVIESYRRVCGNLRHLHGVPERHPHRHAMIEGLADRSRALDVDEHPVLILFGFDEDQKKGTIWKEHHGKLKRYLPERIQLKGYSKDFVRGISR